MVVMTIRENFGDSNCAAMTTKIRKIAVMIAVPRFPNSSFMLSSWEFKPRVMVEVKCLLTTSLYNLFSIASIWRASSVGTSPVMVT